MTISEINMQAEMINCPRIYTALIFFLCLKNKTITNGMLYQ